MFGFVALDAFLVFRWTQSSQNAATDRPAIAPAEQGAVAPVDPVGKHLWNPDETQLGTPTLSDNEVVHEQHERTSTSSSGSSTTSSGSGSSSGGSSSGSGDSSGGSGDSSGGG